MQSADILDCISRHADVRARCAMNCLASWYRRRVTRVCAFLEIELDDMTTIEAFQTRAAPIVMCGILLVDERGHQAREFYSTTPTDPPPPDDMRVVLFNTEESLLRQLAHVLDVCAQTVCTYGAWVQWYINARRTDTVMHECRDFLQHLRERHSTWGCFTRRGIAQFMNADMSASDAPCFNFVLKADLFAREAREHFEFTLPLNLKLAERLAECLRHSPATFSSYPGVSYFKIKIQQLSVDKSIFAPDVSQKRLALQHRVTTATRMISTHMSIE